VVPIQEVDHWIDAPPELAEHLFAVTRHIGRAQLDAFAPARVGVIIAGYEVPHAHIHVIPTNEMRELSFSNAAPSIDRETLDSAAAAIRTALRSQGHDQEVVER
jgi:histidine triad (HIT) family protein